MNPEPRLREVHPHHMGYRLVRRLRSLRHVRGWERCCNILAPPDKAAPFSILNDGVGFEGNTSSYLDRRIYLFGGYEEDAIDLFLSLVRPGKRGVILDVGANVGTHALAFAKSFRHVHSFEPNDRVNASFERNVALNSWARITLHKVGLADVSADQVFYSIDKNNFGVNAGAILHQEAGVKAHQRNEPEGPRYRGPSGFSGFIPEGRRPGAALAGRSVTGVCCVRA